MKSGLDAMPLFLLDDLLRQILLFHMLNYFINAGMPEYEKNWGSKTFWKTLRKSFEKKNTSYWTVLLHVKGEDILECENFLRITMAGVSKFDQKFI